MNENIDLREILKDVPAGTKLYSPLFGEVELQGIVDGDILPVKVKVPGGFIESFASDGRYCKDFNESECTLFPSRDQRDWSKFEYKPERRKERVVLQPFDKVLGRDDEEMKWFIDFYAICGRSISCPHICLRSDYAQVIPYNEETKHLIGTADSPSVDYEIIPWNKE